MKKLLLGLGALAFSAGTALADWSPSGPINLWIGFGAGGETDTLGRLVAQEMSDATGWDIVVENKPGGGGMAMFTQLAAYPADGQTLGMGVTMPVLVNLTIRPDEVPFDLDSFDYIGTVALAQLALVAPADAPYDDLAGLIEYSKEKGGALVAFDAKPQELLMGVVNAQSEAGFKMVTTESSAEALQNLLGGHVDAAFNAGAHIPYLESGELKMIASANASRHSYAPDTGTVREAGYDIYVDPWFYIAAPDGLPEETHTALSEALNNALQSDAVRDAIEKTMHTEPADMGPAETKAMMEDGLKNVGSLFGQ
ncbi:tripartite tricarboxylate transporter substrate binding protein [Psychromarinibacter sp. C21-152]|uniref:Tripartite tricarboxylate transporter substrate binding protein n=1 Tax=Psychromarinibacter sediminicola TaxID=3033385 RepID=A0AAE3TA87_9RHOB|nr:tripartite tricarboxylate transporter substrate binding protein [Psychromarinibacter sediminicola]MDF0603440.1 tripartite tricarboxylate transporter substrate binding protein [Psychromarinibacter sediminicola]